MKEKEIEARRKDVIDTAQNVLTKRFFPSAETAQVRRHDVVPVSKNKKKRKRTFISETQKEILMQFFNVNQNPSPSEYDSISEKCELARPSVLSWFQNERKKIKS